MRISSPDTDVRTRRRWSVLAFALLLAWACALTALAAGAPAESLREQLEEDRNALARVEQAEDQLASTIAEENRRVNDLIAEVAAMRSKVETVQEELAAKQAELARASASLRREERRLELVRARLRRALGVLRRELVQIYMAGTPDVASIVLQSTDWSEVVAQAEYLESIQSYEEIVVERVRSLRDETRGAVERLRVSRRQIEASRDAIAAEEEQVLALRAELEARHAEFVAVRGERQRKLDALESREQALEDNLAAIADQLAAQQSVSGPAPVQTAPPVPGETAQLLPDGTAAPPESAPEAVQAAIEAANRISATPYIWGGGHGSWDSAGYDCSGAVSYALHGGGFLDSPLDSTGLSTWGVPGAGSWITVYANSGHAYAVIAGLRWDTSGDAGGSGPRWHTDMRSAAGYIARHPDGY